MPLWWMMKIPFPCTGRPSVGEAKKNLLGRVWSILSLVMCFGLWLFFVLLLGELNPPLEIFFLSHKVPRHNQKNFFCFAFFFAGPKQNKKIFFLSLRGGLNSKKKKFFFFSSSVKDFLPRPREVPNKNH